MNRLDLWMDASESATEAQRESRDHFPPGLDVTTQQPRGDAAEYHLVQPLHYEANYAYPLIVWIPDVGAKACEASIILPRISSRNFVGVGVDGPRNFGAPRLSGSKNWIRSTIELRRVECNVMRAMDAARERWNVARHRVFVAGRGEGGSMAVRLGLAHPQLFAGAISLGGGLPSGDRPLARLNQARDLPMLILYGRDSDQYGVDDVCQDLRLMHTAGLKASLRQYPCGQEVTACMLSDINSWMMAIVTGSTPDVRFEDARRDLRG